MNNKPEKQKNDKNRGKKQISKEQKKKNRIKNFGKHIEVAFREVKLKLSPDNLVYYDNKLNDIVNEKKKQTLEGDKYPKDCKNCDENIKKYRDKDDIRFCRKDFLKQKDEQFFPILSTLCHECLNLNEKFLQILQILCHESLNKNKKLFHIQPILDEICGESPNHQNMKLLQIVSDESLNENQKYLKIVAILCNESQIVETLCVESPNQKEEFLQTKLKKFEKKQKKFEKKQKKFEKKQKEFEEKLKEFEEKLKELEEKLKEFKEHMTNFKKKVDGKIKEIPPAQPQQPIQTPPAQPEQTIQTQPAQPEQTIQTPPAQPQQPIQTPPAQSLNSNEENEEKEELGLLQQGNISKPKSQMDIVHDKENPIEGDVEQQNTTQSTQQTTKPNSDQMVTEQLGQNQLPNEKERSSSEPQLINYSSPDFQYENLKENGNQIFEEENQRISSSFDFDQCEDPDFESFLGYY